MIRKFYFMLSAMALLASTQLFASDTTECRLQRNDCGGFACVTVMVGNDSYGSFSLELLDRALARRAELINAGICAEPAPETVPQCTLQRFDSGGIASVEVMVGDDTYGGYSLVLLKRALRRMQILRDNHICQ